MSETTVAAGRHGPFAGCLDSESITRYAAATGDQPASVLAGLAMPATIPAILLFTPNEALHRPLVPGEPLQTWSQISAVRTSRAGTRVVMRFASPTPLNCELSVNAFAVNEHSFAFQAIACGTTTITDGRLELRA